MSTLMDPPITAAREAVASRRHERLDGASERGTQARAGAVMRRALLAGLLVGMAECLFFALVLVGGPLERQFGHAAMGPIGGLALILAIVAPFAAGWAFARLARPATQEKPYPAWWAGVLLLLASLVGLVVALTFEAQGQSASGTQLVRIFQMGFVTASGVAALLCSWGVGAILHVRAPFRTAAVIGVATALTYLVVALFLDTLPGWRVGGGDMAMPRVAMVGNFISGTLGGITAFVLFHLRGSLRGHRMPNTANK